MARIDRPGERLLESSSIEARPRPPASPVISLSLVLCGYYSHLIATSHPRTAAKLAPEDPEIAFNLASVLEACQCFSLFWSGLLLRID